MATLNPTGSPPLVTPLANVYTDAPALHPNLFVGTVQLLFWVLVHPAAWRSYGRRIDAGLHEREGNFCLLNLSRAAWRTPELRRVLLAYLLVPISLSWLGSTFYALLMGRMSVLDYGLSVFFNALLSVAMCLGAGLLVSLGGGLGLGLVAVVVPFASTPLAALFVCFLGGIVVNLAYTQDDSVVNVAWQSPLLGGVVMIILSMLFVGLLFLARLWEITDTRLTLLCLVPTAIFFGFIIVENVQHLLSHPSKGVAVLLGVLVVGLGGLVWAIFNVGTEAASQIAFFIPLILVGLFMGLAVGVAWGARTTARAGLFSGLLFAVVCTIFIFATFRILRIETDPEGGVFITYASTILQLGTEQTTTSAIMWAVVLYNWPVAYLLLLTIFAAVYALTKPAFQSPLLQATVPGVACIMVGHLLNLNLDVNGPPWWLLYGIALTFFLWRPLLTYPLLMGWHQFLHAWDNTPPTGEAAHWLSKHAAFWDEHQRLPWWGLSQHLQQVLQQAPQEGQQAVAYLRTSRQQGVVRK